MKSFQKRHKQYFGLELFVIMKQHYIIVTSLSKLTAPNSGSKTLFIFRGHQIKTKANTEQKMPKRKAVLQFLQHFLIGSVLTIKGIDKISHHAVMGSIILLFGIIILAFFIYTLTAKKPSEKLTVLAHWFEAIAALFTAYIFFTEGATYLPYLFLLAAVGFFIGIYVHAKKHRHVSKS